MTTADLLADYLADQRAAERITTDTAAASRFRCSGALSCHRARALDALNIPPSETLSATSLTAFAVGDLWHELIQAAYVYRHGIGFQSEVLVDFRPEIDLTGHADGWLSDQREVIEIKTMQPYAWQLAVNGSSRGGTPEGPKVEHLTQAALYGFALDALVVTLVYVNKGTGLLHEWRFPMDEKWNGSTIRGLAETELWAIRQVALQVDTGQVPERYVPNFGRVAWLPAPDGRDQPWQCRWCKHWGTCRELGPDPVRVGRVHALMAGDPW